MYTHCGVNNFALSVSEAIAKPQMSRVIWTISIVVHSPVLLFFSLELTKFYVDYLYNKVKYSAMDTGLTLNYVFLFRSVCTQIIIFGILELGPIKGQYKYSFMWVQRWGDHFQLKYCSVSVSYTHLRAHET